ncbi:MAG: MFS transporter [Sphaerochaetaceae bacterium]
MIKPLRKLTGMFDLYKGLPLPIYIISLATVINGVGIFVYPFLVLFLTQHLGKSAAWTGTFMSIAALAYLPGSFVGGKLADRIGRKKVMLIGQLLASSMFIVCGFLGKSPLVPVFVFLNLLFDGMTDPARSALQTDVTNQENRQASFSLNYLAHNLGFSIGPVIAGFLFYKAPQWLFFGNGAIGFISVLLVMWKVPESIPDTKAIEASYTSNSTEQAQKGGLFKALFSRPRLLILAVCATFFSFTYSQSLFALPLHTTALYGEKGATLYGSMMSLNAVIVVLCNAPLVLLLRKYHPLRNIALAGLLYAVGFACMGLVKAPIWFYALTIVYTLGEIIDATNIHYYIANNTPMSHRARFSAIMPVIMGFGHGIAPVIGGNISEAYGIGVLWIIIGATALVGAISIYLLYLTDPSRKKPPMHLV